MTGVALKYFELQELLTALVEMEAEIIQEDEGCSRKIALIKAARQVLFGDKPGYLKDANDWVKYVFSV